MLRQLRHSTLTHAAQIVCRRCHRPLSVEQIRTATCPCLEGRAPAKGFSLGSSFRLVQERGQ